MISIVAGSPFGELILAMDAFQYAVDQPGFDKLDNSVAVRNDSIGKGLHTAILAELTSAQQLARK